MKLTDSLKKEFNDSGCVVIANLISTDHATALLEKVIALAAREVEIGDPYFYPFDKSGKTQRVWNLVNKGKMFRDLFEIDLIDEFMNFIFDRNTTHQKYFLSSFQANLISPGSEQQKLHIDTPVPEPLRARRRRRR